MQNINLFAGIIIDFRNHKPHLVQLSCHKASFQPAQLINTAHSSAAQLEPVAQRSCDGPSLEMFKDRLGWGSEQPELAKDVPAHGRETGLTELSFQHSH